MNCLLLVLLGGCGHHLRLHDTRCGYKYHFFPFTLEWSKDCSAIDHVSKELVCNFLLTTFQSKNDSNRLAVKRPKTCRKTWNVLLENGQNTVFGQLRRITFTFTLLNLLDMVVFGNVTLPAWSGVNFERTPCRLCPEGRVRWIEEPSEAVFPTTLMPPGLNCSNPLEAWRLSCR